jgi:ATP-dependent RNA helicase RhlE
MSEEKDTPKEKIYYDQRSVAVRTPQSICLVNEHDKTSMLELILNDYKETQVVVVVKSKKKADALSEFLISKEFNVLAVHGNHREVQQKEASKNFNETSLNIITTDMILKTLDLKNIKLIISHDLPNDAQEYYNRLSLMKEQGIAMALISPEDEGLLNDIEVNMKAEIEERTVKDFVASETPNQSKKDRKKKPRHRKNKVRKEKEI